MLKDKDKARLTAAGRNYVVGLEQRVAKLEADLAQIAGSSGNDMAIECDTVRFLRHSVRLVLAPDAPDAFARELTIIADAEKQMFTLMNGSKMMIELQAANSIRLLIDKS